jgi:hypothetical protein
MNTIEEDEPLESCEEFYSPEAESEITLIDDDPSRLSAHVLAVVKSPAFFPNKISRNKTKYSRQLWDNVLADEEITSKIANRLMFGAFGHAAELDDAELADGMMSHIVTEMYIDPSDNIGYAEFEVLNTESGRNLNTLLRAGSKLSVSTKAKTRWKKLPEGVREAHEDIFHFNRIDFVQKPGFKEALVEVVESLDEISNKEVPENFDNTTTGNIMTKTVEELTASLEELQVKFNESNEELTLANENLDLADSIIEEFQTVKADEEKVAEEMKDKKAHSDMDMGMDKDSPEYKDYMANKKGEETYAEYAAGKKSLEKTTAGSAKEDLVVSKEELATQDSIKVQLVEAQLSAAKEELVSVSAELSTAKEDLAKFDKYVDSVEELEALITLTEQMTKDAEEARIVVMSSDLGIEVSAIESLITSGVSIGDVASVVESIRPAKEDLAPAAEEDKSKMSTSRFRTLAPSTESAEESAESKLPVSRASWLLNNV